MVVVVVVVVVVARLRDGAAAEGGRAEVGRVEEAGREDTEKPPATLMCGGAEGGRVRISGLRGGRRSCADKGADGRRNKGGPLLLEGGMWRGVSSAG